ncbi:MAG: COX15/CtaA family protein [Rickettsiales bacterium]
MQPIPRHLPAIRRWLNVCLLLVGLMVLVGGVTRLTESGLSIVEWKLVSGTLPPMTEAAWQAEFSDYQTSPQFMKVNRTFTLGDFKQIFWLEYIHRLLGRIIGLTIILPFAYFAAQRALPKPMLRRGLGLCVLVAAQGTVGWVMVASGLVDQPRVAPIKLGLHLLLAFALFCALLWTRWQITSTPPLRGSQNRHSDDFGGGQLTGTYPPTKTLTRFDSPARGEWVVALAARALLALVTLQIFAGALVAGLRAGKAYNTYPLMDGKFIPEGLHTLNPWWLNHVESVATVQFQHRMLALLVAASVLAFAWLARRVFAHAQLLGALAATVCLQFALGVATLLTGVNIALASAHQLVALLLLGLLLRVCYLTPRLPR